MPKATATACRYVVRLSCATVFLFFSAAAPADCEPSTLTLRIGAILDLTGPLASMGTAVNNGIKLAAEEINHKKSLSIEILVEDPHGNPNEAVSAAHKLIDLHGVRLIIGPLRSSSVLAVAPITEQKRVIVFSPTDSAAEISLAGDYVFRNRESGEVHGRTIAKFLHRQNLQNVAIFTADSANSRTYSDEFEEYFSGLGGRIVASTSYDPSQRDFRTEVTRLRSASAQAVYISVATGSDAAVLVRQLREGGFSGVIAGSPAVALHEFLDGAGAHAEGVVVSAPAFDANDPAIVAYTSSYMRRYGYPSDAYAANAYDALHMLARAVIACNGDKTSCIRDFLYRLEDFPGASGLQSFDLHGDIQRAVSLLIVRNGKYEPYLSAKATP